MQKIEYSNLTAQQNDESVITDLGIISINLDDCFAFISDEQARALIYVLDAAEDPIIRVHYDLRRNALDCIICKSSENHQPALIQALNTYFLGTLVLGDFDTGNALYESLAAFKQRLKALAWMRRDVQVAEDAEVNILISTQLFRDVNNDLQAHKQVHERISGYFEEEETRLVGAAVYGVLSAPAATGAFDGQLIELISVGEDNVAACCE